MRLATLLVALLVAIAPSARARVIFIVDSDSTVEFAKKIDKVVTKMFVPYSPS